MPDQVEQAQGALAALDTRPGQGQLQPAHAQQQHRHGAIRLGRCQGYTQRAQLAVGQLDRTDKQQIALLLPGAGRQSHRLAHCDLAANGLPARAELAEIGGKVELVLRVLPIQRDRAASDAGVGQAHAPGFDGVEHPGRQRLAGRADAEASGRAWISLFGLFGS